MYSLLFAAHCSHIIESSVNRLQSLDNTAELQIGFGRESPGRGLARMLGWSDIRFLSRALRSPGVVMGSGKSKEETVKEKAPLPFLLAKRSVYRKFSEPLSFGYLEHSHQKRKSSAGLVGKCFLRTVEARDWQRQIRGESRRIDRDISRMRFVLSLKGLNWLRLPLGDTGQVRKRRSSRKKSKPWRKRVKQRVPAPREDVKIAKGALGVFWIYFNRALSRSGACML